MEIIEIKKKALLLDKKENEQLLFCLKFCRDSVKCKLTSLPLSFMKYAIGFLEGEDEQS